MADGYDLVRRLAITFVRMDGAYYMCAKKLGVKENMLDLLYALDDGAPHTQKQICGDWLMPKTLLYALDDGAPHTQKQICGDWLMPKTTVNTSVKELVAAGCAELLPAEGGREKTIRLTEKGRRLAEEIMGGVHAAEQAALAKTVEKFSDEFIAALECYAEHYCAEIDKLPARGKEERLA